MCAAFAAFIGRRSPQRRMLGDLAVRQTVRVDRR